jgi:hypothetical protein
MLVELLAKPGIRHTPDQHVLEVLARMLVSAAEQGDLLSSTDLRDDTRGEHTIAVFSVFAPKSIFRSRAMVVFLLPTA